MAIVLPSRPADESNKTSLGKLIAQSRRPAILVKGGTFQPDEPDSPWAEILERSRSSLENAIRAVARVEGNDPVLPFLGTAFVVDKKLAVTANYVADLLLQRRRRNSDDQPKELARIWLNFKAEHGSDESERIDVREIYPVHPYWGFAFLELEKDVDAGRVLKLGPKQSEDELKDRDICVIGFPAQDVRNEAVQMAIFKEIYGVKRLMPGKVTGMGYRSRSGEDGVTLLHDATTTGGCSGAPLIDLQTGSVLGVHYAGIYLVENHAAPAWEIDRDPLWWRNLKDEKLLAVLDPAAIQRQAVDLSVDDTPILSFDEVIALHTRLMKLGATEEKITLLFAGLPNEYVAALTDKGNPTERLLAMLHDVNNTGGMIRDHSAFYYMLKNAERMRSWDSQWTGEIQKLLTQLAEREKQRR